MSKVRLVGGPFDGTEIPWIGWIEAIALSNDTGVHWYVYTGPPIDADEGHQGDLDHIEDHTFERVFDVMTPAHGESLESHHRRNVNFVIGKLRESLRGTTDKK
jgi:hypothetical protein